MRLGPPLKKKNGGRWGGPHDVAHVLAADLGAGDLDAAALADDALVAHALVLAAVALPVLGRTEDALAEEPVLLGLERAVVDRLRLGHFPRAPAADLLGGSEADLDGVEVVDVDHSVPFRVVAVTVRPRPLPPAPRRSAPFRQPRSSRRRPPSRPRRPRRRP